MAAQQTRCGTIVLAGEPNAGKSTLLNALVGTRLAITSAKPQSTRQRVIGIRTEGSSQIVFVDPPGLLEPHYLLQETMLDEAIAVLTSADAILHLHRAADAPAPPLEQLVPPGCLRGQPIATVYTAVDTIARHRRPDASTSVFPVGFLTAERTSHEHSTGTEPLLAWCRAQLPQAPFRHDPDDLSTQPVRFFVTEFIREVALEVLHEELPYSLAAQVDEFRESSDPVYIRVTLFVERESQKGMVIGAGGRVLKQIGAGARARIEALLGSAVYLDLWVKVLPRWRKSSELLRELGFCPPPQRSS
jgi:GTP-binding protein Era